MTTFEKLQRQYPDKEIKLITEKFIPTYINFGFKVIYEGTQKSEVSSDYDVEYAFMVED